MEDGDGLFVLHHLCAILLLMELFTGHFNFDIIKFSIYKNKV